MCYFFSVALRVEPGVRGEDDPGVLVMDGLRNLDTVAYVRYASVYKDFQEVDDFSEFIKGEKLGHEDELDGEQ